MRHLNQRQLEAFVAVMETGTAVAAAESLCLTQPAISRSIALLEESCGFALFERTGTGLRPTPEAFLLLREAQAWFRQGQRLASVASRIGRREYGHATVAAFPALASTLLPDVVAEFLAQRSGTRVSVMGSEWRQLNDHLISQKIDLAVTGIEFRHPAVECVPLCRYPVDLVLPPDHPLAALERPTVADLNGVRMVMLDRDDKSVEPIQQFLDSNGVEPEIVAQATYSQTVCALVANGVGAALVDRFVARKWTDRLVIRPLPDAPMSDLWIARPAKAIVSLIASDLYDHCRTRLIDLVSAGPEVRG